LVAYGYGYVTQTMTINYIKPVRLGAVLNVEAIFDKKEEKKLFCSGVIRDNDTIYATATTIYYLRYSLIPYTIINSTFGQAMSAPKEITETGSQPNAKL